MNNYDFILTIIVKKISLPSYFSISPRYTRAFGIVLTKLFRRDLPEKQTLVLMDYLKLKFKGM